MNPARWAGLGKLLGHWPGDGDGLVYIDELQGEVTIFADATFTVWSILVRPERPPAL